MYSSSTLWFGFAPRRVLEVLSWPWKFIGTVADEAPMVFIKGLKLVEPNFEPALLRDAKLLLRKETYHRK